MSRTTRRKKAVGPLKIEGDLNIYTAAAVQQRLLGALSAGEASDLDLGDVAEFDTAGAQLLLSLARECDALGRPLRIVAASDCVRDVFGTFGLASRLTVAAANG